MKRVLLLVAVVVATVALPAGRTAQACAECASSNGVVGCRYRFFYGKQCAAFWNSSTNTFTCQLSGECDEVGPPEPGGGGQHEPWNPDLPPGIWTGLTAPVELPDRVLALLPDISRGAIRPLS